MTFVLLDFDGPIVDLFDTQSGLLLTHTIVEVAGDFGVDAAYIPESSLFIPVWAIIRETIIGTGRDVAAFDRQVHTAIERHEFEMVRNASADPCSVEVLAAARRFADGVAIVSNNSAKAISSWLSRHRLVHTVDFISGRDAEKAFESLKPNPDLITRALRNLGCRPPDAIFVGDTESDYLSSRAAGVKFIGLKTRHSVIAREDGHDSTVWLLNSRSDVSRYIRATLAR